jgi:putative ABC transport system permease protein
MLTVVGVVGDVRYNPNVGMADMPTYYVPVAQAHPWRTMSLIVRTKEDPAAMTRRIERAVASVAPAVAPGSVLTLDALHRMSLSPQRLTSLMMGSFAIIAVVLAAIGIYGVMSYTVARRTHDIGIRIALGAHSRDIVGTVLGMTRQPLAIGIVAGVLGAVMMTRVLAHLLTQFVSNDLVALGASLVVLVVAALAGSYLPARRAVRVDPVVALRTEK